jgi:hypothetical protein
VDKKIGYALIAIRCGTSFADACSAYQIDGKALKSACIDAAIAAISGGQTWANAADLFQVSQSSIMRAMDKRSTYRCQCCGQVVKAKKAIKKPHG